MPVLEIKAKHFIAGESRTDAISDKGFSPDSHDLNLTKMRGMLYFNEEATDRGGATLTGNMVADCIDPVALGNDAYYVDDEANFYTMDGATLTKEQTGANTYQLGTTEIIPFRGELYATSQTAVAYLTNDMAALTENWWSGLTAGYRHPMERVEDELFIADQNIIYYWNGTASGVAFTLPNGMNVTTMRRHPNGRTLLAFTSDNAQNFSHSEGGAGKVYYCDPVLRGWTREVQLEAQVEGSRIVGGVVYVTYGKNFGFFNGNGLVPLKQLTDATTYSHNLDNMEDIILIRDDRNVLAYGDLGNGNVFWKCARNRSNSSPINNIHYKGDNKLLYAYTDGAGAGDLKEIDFDNSGAFGAFYTNRYSFGGEVKISMIEIIHDLSNSGGITSFDVITRNIEGGQAAVEQISYNSQEVSKTTINCDLTADIFQAIVALTSDDIGFRLIRVHYQPITGSGN